MPLGLEEEEDGGAGGRVAEEAFKAFPLLVELLDINCESDGPKSGRGGVRGGHTTSAHRTFENG